MPEKRLKNASARLTTRPIDTIQEALASHHARHISLDYEAGQAVALTFVLEIRGARQQFRMPARVERVLLKLYGKRASYTETQRRQAHVTGWANIRDWVLAQLALIDTEMVRMEEVFLPYMLLDEQTTYYEAYARYEALPQLPTPQGSPFTIIEEK